MSPPILVPRIWRIAATWAWFVPDTACRWFSVGMRAGGGGGAGTSNQHYIPPVQYGQRGGDTMFHLRPAVSASFNFAASGLVINGANSLVADQAIILESVPNGVGLQAYTPYYPINVTPVSFQISVYPYTPPFGGQSPIVCAPVGQTMTIAYRPTWYGVRGGGGGGIIGDQGTPLGYWGMDGQGPDGWVQSYGMQGGSGSGGYKVGGAGGNSDAGGGAGQSYQDNGIWGTNLTGGGGGGGSPVVTPSPLEWGGCGGASGSWGEVYIRPEPGVMYFCLAGKGGIGGPPGAGGYWGGNGGHGLITVTSFF